MQMFTEETDQQIDKANSNRSTGEKHRKVDLWQALKVEVESLNRTHKGKKSVKPVLN